MKDHAVLQGEIITILKKSAPSGTTVPFSAKLGRNILGDRDSAFFQVQRGDNCEIANKSPFLVFSQVSDVANGPLVFLAGFFFGGGFSFLFQFCFFFL